MQQFHFLRPYWLWLLLPALMIVLILKRRGARDGDWSRVIAPELLQHLLSGDQRRRSARGLYALLLLWCLGALAAAGPSWQQLPQPVLQKQDALVLVMDLSYSMLATDLEPSRADRVRRKLLDLLRQREEGLSALIAYAGDAHVVAPLTDDHRTIANLLPALNPQMMPLPGSNAPDALRQALQLFDSAGIRSGRVLLVTDGIDGSDQETIAGLLSGTAHRLAVLGVGTDVGAPIPLPQGGFLKDEAGSIVVPALEESPLRALAGDTGGSYQRLRVDDQDLERLLDATSSLVDEENIQRDRKTDQWQDMAHWFSLPLLLACLLGFRRGWVYSVALCLLLPTGQARADIWNSLWQRDDQRAQRLLEQGNPQDAASMFSSPDWAGVAAWEAGDYQQSLDAFSRSEDADSWYNRGNALAAQGRLDEAIAAYEKSLDLEPGSEDALHNIDTLKKLKEEQERQQQEQQQQQQNQQAGDSDDQQQDGAQSDDSGSADDGQQGQQSPSPGNEGDREQQQQRPGQEQQQDNEGKEGQAQDENSGQQQARELPPLSPQMDNSAMQESLERDQAREQWLRRIPDDPSGLLREKFRYESRQRQQQGQSRDARKTW